jgi:hypothetical protein
MKYNKKKTDMQTVSGRSLYGGASCKRVFIGKKRTRIDAFTIHPTRRRELPLDLIDVFNLYCLGLRYYTASASRDVVSRDEVMAATAATKGSSALYNVFICLMVFVAVVVVVILFNRPLPLFSFGVSRRKTTSAAAAFEFPDDMVGEKACFGGI